MFSFFNKNKPPYSVEKIEQGQLLDKATEVDVPFFFNRWIQKRPRKALVGTCFILYEDQEAVYFGYPVFARLFSNKRIVQEFYKVLKKNLKTTFPNYKKQEGNRIRLRLHELIAEREGDKVSVSIHNFTGKILDRTFEFTIIGYLTDRVTGDKPPSRAVSYRIVLDKKNLDCLGLEPTKHA